MSARAGRAGQLRSEAELRVLVRMHHLASNPVVLQRFPEDGHNFHKVGARSSDQKDLHFSFLIFRVHILQLRTQNQTVSNNP